MNIVLADDQIERIKSLAKSEEMTWIANIMKERYKTAWANTNLEDEEHRKHLYRMITAVDGLLAEMQGIAIDSAISAHNKKLKGVR